jgi:hypothetical protein
MKKVVSILSLVILFAACKKETVESSPLNAEVAKIKATLSDSLTEQEMNAIDWSKAKPISIGKEIAGYQLKISSDGTNNMIYAFHRANGYSFVRHQYAKSNDYLHFDGFNTSSNLFATQKITNYYANNQLQKTIELQNGFEVVTFDINTNQGNRLTVIKLPASWFVPPYLNLFQIPHYYGYEITEVQGIQPDEGGGGSIGMLEFEVDGSESATPRDIEKIFKCFEQVPDGPNTTYTVKLCADVPVNGSPTAPNLLFSAGHAFLVITKSNGSITISQPFGFYPVNGPASLDLSPVANKIVIDSEHEINASLEMNCGKAQFDSMKAHSILLTNTKFYDLDNYNCANFALDVFNKARSSSNQIQVNALYATTPFTFPIGIVIWKSPQGIFEKLQLMKDANHPEANKIVIDQTRSTKSPFGSGECQ